MANAHPPLVVDTLSTNSHPYWHELRTMGAHPHRRSSHSAVVWNNLMIVYGGQDLREGLVPGLWACTINENSPEMEAWEEWPSDESFPPGLGRHSAVLLQDNMYVFGGTDQLHQNANVYILNLPTRTWSTKLPEKAGLPPAIDSHTAVLSETKMVVFGGFVGGSKSNLVFVLDLATMKWSAPHCHGPLPVPRVSHSAAVFQSSMYVFAGTSEEGTKLNDLWKLDLHAYNWRRIEPRGDVPEGRSGHTACSYRSVMVVFGGGKELTKETNEMWALKLDGEEEWVMIQEERKIEDPVTAVQLEEYKKSKSMRVHSSNSPQTAGSPSKKHSDSPDSPDDSPLGKKKHYAQQHLYEGPPSPLVGRIVGRAPYPRDGHSAVVFADKMYVFGGDRYQMPFNDFYVFSLNEVSLRGPRLIAK